MKKLLILLMTACSTLMMQGAKVEKDVTIKVGDKNRTFKLYVPNNVKEDAPLVLSLHGAGGHSTDKSPFRTDVADNAGCIVVYPQGLDTVFPGLGGMSAPGWSAYGEENFDTDFLKAIIEKVASDYSIDRKRIYCCGFSNGGMMTYVMANTCSHIIAAFAAISGYPINEFHLHHTSWRPVPFLHIHGKADDFVKYSLVPNVIDNMIARNGANPVPVKTTKSGKYDKSIYEAGEGGFPIIFYEIDGMGHNDFTNNTEDNSSAKTMWNFFKQYTLDSPCDTTLKWRPRIEEEGYEPKKHGWTINNSTTLLKFGGVQKTDANQNVYKSLQFINGKYKLHFKAEGDPSQKIIVKIEKASGKKNAVLKDTVNISSDINLFFEVTDGWGEYKFTILRQSATDAITITDLGIYTATDEELSSVQSTAAPRTDFNDTYNLLGMRVKEAKSGNIYIRNNKKFLIK